MIGGKTKTEANYRAINLDSSSSLKEFSFDRKKYYKKYILGEKVEDDESSAATMGKLVETLLMEPDEFDNRFYMSACASAPTGLMLEFVEALYKYTKEATNEDGVVTRDFVDIAKDAYVDSGFKIKFDAVINKFNGSDAEVYYNEVRKVRAKNLSVVTAQDVDNAEKVVEGLKTNFVTVDIVNLVNSSRYSIYNQLQIEGYKYNGLTFKSMLDKVVVNHEEKTIQVYDLKCVWAVEGFYEQYYLYRRAYIQAFLYIQGITDWAIQNDLSDYEILPMSFIVCDSTNYYNPLIYVVDVQDLLDAQNGFEHKGRTYPGVNEIVGDLKWAVDNDIWNISMKNYKNNGVVNIKG
jgi:hypothetical protein